MKVAANGVERFVKAPPPGVRAVLVYGPDTGKVLEFAKAIGRSAVDNLDDPFNVCELDGDEAAGDPARLSDEMHARSLMGGRRLVRLRNARDSHADAVANALEGDTGDSLLVVEGGDLKPSGGLRKLFEAKREDIAALPCYADSGRDLASMVRDVLAAGSVRIEPEAERFLIDHLGGDRMASRMEVEKLALLAGAGSTVDLATVVEAVGDSSALDIDSVISAAADGRPDAILTGLNRAFRQGEASVRIVRMALTYFQRLHLARARVEDGRNPADAIKSLRPPVFFRTADAMARQAARWDTRSLASALARLGEAEIRCKTTGFPDEAECGQALIDVARLAVMAGRRSGGARR
ncbi:MAG: DNA polymerase III subunit delta [Alphaproteobacteria bacterium]|nr:DNA polymerase III subunit delta [Alphaproteobacteria bacterium]